MAAAALNPDPATSTELQARLPHSKKMGSPEVLGPVASALGTTSALLMQRIMDAEPALAMSVARTCGLAHGKDRLSVHNALQKLLSETELAATGVSAQRKRHRGDDSGSTSAPIALQQLVAVKEEKKEAQRSLNEAREDLDDAEQLVSQQALYTDFLQSKLNEMESLALSAGADPSTVNEIMARKYGREP